MTTDSIQPVARPGKPPKVLSAAALLVLGGVFLLYAVLVVLAGGSALGLVLYPAMFLLAVELPGMWLCRLLLPRGATALEKAVIALPLGALLVMVCFSLLGWVLPPWLCVLPCCLLGATCLAKWVAGNRAAFGHGFVARWLGRVGGPGWCLVLLFCVGLFLYLWLGVFAFAKAEAAGNMVYNQDMLWSVGNAASAAYGIPVRDLRAAGGIMHYHYLTDILCGLVAIVSGQSAWDAACFYNWPLFFAGLCGGLYTVSRRFGAKGYAALLAPVGALFAHFAWDASLKHIFQNVNGVLQNYLYLVATLLVLQIAEGENAKGPRALAAFSLCTAALLWSKSTTGLLFVCAVLAAFAVKSLLAKKPNKWLLAAGTLGLATFGALYLLVYRHAINNLVWMPRGEAVCDAFRLLGSMYLPGLVLYGVSVVFSLRQMKEISGAGLLVNAMVPGGILAYILFYHYSFSQSYFLLAASFAMWLCVARVAGQMVAIKPLRWLAAGLCAVGFASSLWYATPALRKGAQVALRCAGLRPSLPAEMETVTPDDAAAAIFLRENMAKGDVFATNRNQKNSDASDGVFHYYTAASGRQALVEGWRYAMDYSIEYTLLRHNLEAVSDGIFAQQDWDSAKALAAENGIAYLLVYLPHGGHPFTGGQQVLATDTVLVYKV